jgi:hypothetical protein
VDLRTGSRWASQVCNTEVVVVRTSNEPVELECGGQPMAPLGTEPSASLTMAPAFAGGSQIGKRFADPSSGLELLVTKAGEGTLAVDGISIPPKEAKPLPSSD